jgi:uncharacterized membrane protein
MTIIKAILRVLFGAAFIFAGVSHFLQPGVWVPIVPPYLPFPLALVYISGAAEIALGALLMVPAFSQPAAWGLIALLIAVFPANVHMAMNPDLFPQMSRTALLVRLPIQAVLIAIAYWFTRRPRPSSVYRPARTV